MYIAQGRSSNRKWIYWVFPSLFFLMMIFNYIASLTIKIDYKEFIAKIGEIPFLIIMISQFAFFLFVLFLIVKLIHNQNITSLTTSRKKIDFKRFFFAFGVLGFFLIIMTLIQFKFFPQDFVWNFKPLPFFSLVIVCFLLLPLQTSFEEYFFRGYLLQGLGIICKNKWFPLLFTSVMFGLMHIANPEIEKLGYGFLSMYIAIGIIFGITTLMDEGLELALGMHASNNIFAALLVTSDWSAIQTPSLLKEIGEPDFNFTYICTILSVFLLTLFIFAKKYKWTNWKEKLFGKITASSQEND